MPSLLPAVLVLALGASAPPSGAAEVTAARVGDAPTLPPASPPGPEAPAAEPPGPEEAALAPRRYTIERIDVLGLDATGEHEVRKRLLVASGEVLDDQRVLLSRLRLLQLGWFSRVDTRVERGSARGLVVLVFDLARRNTLLVSDLVLGWTPPQGFYFGAGLVEQNFLGRGLGLSGSFVYGGSRLDAPQDPSLFGVRGSFFAPDLPWGRQRLVAGASLFFLRGEEFTCTDPGCDAFRSNYSDAPRLRYERFGGELVFGFRPGPFERILGGFRAETISSEVLAGAGTEMGAAPYLLPGDSLLTALTGTYEIDTRDDSFFPREGVRGSAQITFASRFFGGDYDYSRYLVQFETAYSLFRQPLRLQLAVGAVQGDAPFFDRFYGADLAYFSIGPALGRAMELNYSTDSRYDAGVAMAGLEYAVPAWTSRRSFLRRGIVVLGVRGVIAVPGPDQPRTEFSSWPVSMDVALRIETPVGLFNLSLGAVVDLVW
jgi:outer membrane protein assembly factor BamA